LTTKDGANHRCWGRISNPAPTKRESYHLPEQYQKPGRGSRECGHWWFDYWDRLINGALGLAGVPIVKLESGEIAIDTHVHTLFSHCSINQPEVIIRWAVKIGLNGICIMDHNNTRGIEDAERCADFLKESKVIPQGFLIIPGVEINADCGHIGGMFMRAAFPIGMTPWDTVKAIHDEGGLAVAVHPYHSTGIRDAVFDVPFDAVEVECGSVFGRDLVLHNRQLGTDARLSNVTKLGSSDAHYVRALASCYTVLKPQTVTLDGVRQAILDGKSSPRVSDPCRRMRSLLGGIRKLK